MDWDGDRTTFVDSNPDGEGQEEASEDEVEKQAARGKFR